MMKVTLTYKGKKHELPTSAKDLTLWQYQALEACYTSGRTDSASLISAITGLPISAVMESEGNADLFPAILDGMANEIASWPTADAAKAIEVRGAKYTVKAWGLQTLGQRIAYRQATEDKDYISVMHVVLAILVARDVYGDKWGENYIMLAEEMRYAPAHVAVPMLFFFLEEADSYEQRWTSTVIFPPNSAFEKHGGEKMAVFGLINVVEDLAEGHVWLWEKIVNLENNVVLVKMQRNAHLATIEYNIRHNGNTNP